MVQLTTNLDLLEDSILLEIFSTLDAKNLAQLRRLNKRIQKLLDRTNPKTIAEYGLEKASKAFPQLKIRRGQIEFFKNSLQIDEGYKNELITILDKIALLLLHDRLPLDHWRIIAKNKLDHVKLIFLLQSLEKLIIAGIASTAELINHLINICKTYENLVPSILSNLTNLLILLREKRLEDDETLINKIPFFLKTVPDLLTNLTQCNAIGLLDNKENYLAIMEFTAVNVGSSKKLYEFTTALTNLHNDDYLPEQFSVAFVATSAAQFKAWGGQAVKFFALMLHDLGQRSKELNPYLTYQEVIDLFAPENVLKKWLRATMNLFFEKIEERLPEEKKYIQLFSTYTYLQNICELIDNNLINIVITFVSKIELQKFFAYNEHITKSFIQSIILLHHANLLNPNLIKILKSKALEGQYTKTFSTRFIEFKNRDLDFLVPVADVLQFLQTQGPTKASILLHQLIKIYTANASVTLSEINILKNLCTRYENQDVLNNLEGHLGETVTIYLNIHKILAKKLLNLEQLHSILSKIELRLVCNFRQLLDSFIPIKLQPVTKKKILEHEFNIMRSNLISDIGHLITGIIYLDNKAIPLDDRVINILIFYFNKNGKKKFSDFTETLISLNRAGLLYQFINIEKLVTIDTVYLWSDTFVKIVNLVAESNLQPFLTIVIENLIKINDIDISSVLIFTQKLIDCVSIGLDQKLIEKLILHAKTHLNATIKFLELMSAFVTTTKLLSTYITLPHLQNLFLNKNIDFVAQLIRALDQLQNYILDNAITVGFIESIVCTEEKSGIDNLLTAYQLAKEHEIPITSIERNAKNSSKTALEYVNEKIMQKNPSKEHLQLKSSDNDIVMQFKI